MSLDVLKFNNNLIIFMGLLKFMKLEVYKKYKFYVFKVM